ncbi:MAG: hypothetical protein ACK5QC_04585 [Bacteroidota bacterium]
MKKHFKKLTDLFRIKNKKLRIANYVALGLLVIYLGLIIYPNFLFGHSFKYKRFNVYSTQLLGDSIQRVLDEAEIKLSVSEIYDKDLTHNIYLCNNYTLYTFLAPFSRKAFACNYPFINNIFIANCDIDKNEAYKNDKKDKYTRQLSVLISHETTHTLIEKKIGFWKFRTLSNWKNEGYCDYVAYGQTDNLKEGQEFLIKNKNNKKPGTDYRKYYIAVNYLMITKKMTFDNILSTELSFEDVLKKVELAE